MLSWYVAVVIIGSTAMVGCERAEPIVTYSIPTEVPEQLKLGEDRMLATMVPHGDDVWFFKVTGPKAAIDTVESSFRQFVRGIEFNDSGEPVLDQLPDTWRRGGEKPMRFASIDVDTPDKQLDISISKLSRQPDWDQQVQMNVNRWRGQLGLSPSDERWGGGEEFEVTTLDTSGVWVDLIGSPAEAAAPMTPPFAGQPRVASDLDGGGGGGEPATPEPDSRLKFQRPEGWRDGRMTSMRMAAFSVGPEDSPAELTVIPAGGDLRGNVARWLGQVREGEVSDEVVDKALSDAQVVEVDGRPGQRFLLAAEDAETGTAIDATIVPIDDGISLFVKMTGPAKVVTEQSDAIASFLESLELNL